MLRVSLSVLLVAICLLPVGIGSGASAHSHAVAALDGALANTASGQAQVLEAYFARARSIDLLTANNPAFRRFYRTPGDQRMYAQKTSGRRSPDRQSRDVLLWALQERSPDLAQRHAAVARLVEMVAERLGLPAEERAQLRQAAELHDVGKLGIPEVILHKPGPLNPEEWAFVRRHPLIGERIIGAAPALAAAAKLVRSTHERVDGGGYPDRLIGEQIPLGARIISVCDAFTAMTSPRPTPPSSPSQRPCPSCAEPPTASSTPPLSTSSRSWSST
jgi:HD-GYP domain-containing protein (c-di-GMP phosphodiesterase class II)